MQWSEHVEGEYLAYMRVQVANQRGVLATLAAAVVMLIWFATVDPRRLMDSPRQPSLMLFLLAMMGFAVVLTAALIIGTGTLLFVALLTLVSIGVGFARAVGHRYRQPIEGDDGVS